MSIPNYPITITAVAIHCPLMGGMVVQLRARASCNGESLYCTESIPLMMTRGVFDVLPDGQVAVLCSERFNRYVTVMKRSLMEVIADSYQPRFTLGG